ILFKCELKFKVKLNVIKRIYLEKFLLKFTLFSSRRRQTKWPRDWSSDVCSSDLVLHQYGYVMENGRIVLDGDARTIGENEDIKRSEERRVGKESRSQKLSKKIKIKLK